MILKHTNLLRLGLTVLCGGLMALSLSVNLASAHPGRTAADGCHNDRKAGAGHCHDVKNARTSPRSNLTTRKKKSNVSVYYRNCTAARAAGVAPIRRGEKGYARHLDRDNDGIACE